MCPFCSAEHYRWFGQNTRTRKFGIFQRKMIVFSRGPKEISGPIRGSFVHTGHGDARGGSSWGRPETIDEIYLQNPMPLIDFGSTNHAISPEDPTRRLEIVPSVLNIKSRTPPPRAAGRGPPIRGPRNCPSTSSAGSEDLVDPFAPFDEYDETPLPPMDQITEDGIKVCT